MGYKQQLERLQKRNVKLYQYHLDNPLMSVRALGGTYHLTGSRVSQIIIEMKAKIEEDNNADR